MTCHDVSPVIGKIFGEAEVDQFDVSEFIQYQIFWFQILRSNQQILIFR
jgi:hypothetical protein